MMPVQKFRLGDRVKQKGLPPFIVTWVKVIDDEVAYSSYGNSWYWQSKLTLAPVRPPYVASERLVISLNEDDYRWTEGYRCETDAEMAARHAVERAKYDRQDATDAVIYNASGQFEVDGRTLATCPDCCGEGFGRTAHGGGDEEGDPCLRCNGRGVVLVPSIVTDAINAVLSQVTP